MGKRRRSFGSMAPALSSGLETSPAWYAPFARLLPTPGCAGEWARTGVRRRSETSTAPRLLGVLSTSWSSIFSSWRVAQLGPSGPSTGVSPGPARPEHHRQSAEHDQQVLTGGLVPDVLQIALQLAAHVVHGSVIGQGHLREPGDAGPHPLASLIRFDLLAQLDENDGLLRPGAHDVHVARQHVEELRQLVEPELTKHTPDGRHAIVVGARPHLPVVGRAI